MMIAGGKAPPSGVGSLESGGQDNLRDRNLIDVLNEKVLVKKTPILGICLGLQMFTRYSEEGDAAGLAWIDAETRRFKFPPESPLRIPHIGWNEVVWRKEHAITRGVPSGSCFYFAHSYAVRCMDDGDVLATTHYGSDYASAVQKENIIGTNSMKRYQYGFQLLRNFIN
ncbi:MAG: imidazole glycerol phosphate synthase subunit HisH [Planctomycetota bacterium]